MAQASRGLYVRVGALILVGLGLAVGFVLFLASGKLGQHAATYETYLDESVQGLDVGAPVRYRGVQIGRISEIGLVAAEYHRPGGEPFGDVFQLVLVRFALDLSRVGDMPSLEESIRLGLRVRIASQGITGVNYLEIDYVSHPERYPPRQVPWVPRYPYIPAIPSTVAQVTSAAEALVARLQAIDFEGLIGNLAGLVTDLRGQVQSGDLGRALAEAATTMTTLRGVVQEAGVPLRPSISTRQRRQEPKASTMSVAQSFGTFMPASIEARMMEVPSGTVISLPSMVSVTIFSEREAGGAK